MHLKFFLFVLLVLSGDVIFSQSGISLESKTGAMIKRIQKEHIQPRKIDAAFAQDVHKLFIDKIDPGHVYFSKENENQFLANLSTLETDLSSNKLTYFTLVKNELKKSIDEYNLQLETWKNTPQTLNTNLKFS